MSTLSYAPHKFALCTPCTDPAQRLCTPCAHPAHTLSTLRTPCAHPVHKFFFSKKDWLRFEEFPICENTKTSNHPSKTSNKMLTNSSQSKSLFLFLEVKEDWVCSSDKSRKRKPRSRLSKLTAVHKYLPAKRAFVIFQPLKAWRMSRLNFIVRLPLIKQR